MGLIDMNVSQGLGLVIGIGALLIIGLICSFFLIISAHKEELWEEIYDKYIKGEDDDR